MSRVGLSLRVASAERLSRDCRLLELDGPDDLPEAMPGQFAMLRPLRSGVLLGRPFSIAWQQSGRLGFILREVGRGTAELSGLQAGEEVLAVLPLGRGFDLGLSADPVLVGGGVGVPPLLLAADRLGRAGRNCTLVIGGRTAGDVAFYRRWTDHLACRTVWCTDDGSLGLAGNVLAGLGTGRHGSLHACGPEPMLAAVARFARRQQVPCEVSLERVMACGVGVCQGCVVGDVQGRWRKACTEGPVFPADQIFGDLSGGGESDATA